MGKRLFLSCFSEEVAMAAELKKSLEYAFKDELVIVAPLDDLKCGDDWKEYIRAELDACDGLISLITPAYARRAWCIAEFVPFWMAGKRVFPVTMGFEGASADLFKLITDRYQTARLEDSRAVEKLLEAIADFCGAEKPDREYLDAIVGGCQLKYDQIIAKESAAGAGSGAAKLNPFIERYLKNSTVWEYSLNEAQPGVLSAACAKEIQFISASDNTQYLEMPLRALSADGISIRLEEADAGGKAVRLGDIAPTKNKTSYSYKIRFTPPLSKGEVVKLRYSIAIPQCKCATSEKAWEFARDNRLIDPHKESTTVRVDAQTDAFNLKIVLAPGCRVAPLEIQARQGGSAVHTEELEHIREHSCYSSGYDPAAGYVMELRRERPPLGTYYTFSWGLPSKDEL
ncbi:MAG: toll/interleukin-1 receptor domain-containing protein [Christensenellaceae bacterium]|jgi:hypothetical protein|nr:toll/interleukin-1 receptor domain-containing protein [Christensenellaceae bacterium]